jgi:hypothetical protein
MFGLLYLVCIAISGLIYIIAFKRVKTVLRGLVTVIFLAAEFTCFILYHFTEVSNIAAEYAAVVIALLFCLINKSFFYGMAMLCVAAADFCLVIMHAEGAWQNWGIAAFILVQLLFMLKIDSVLGVRFFFADFALRSFIAAAFLGVLSLYNIALSWLYLLAAVYAAMSLLNIILSTLSGRLYFLTVGLILLLLCDVYIGLSSFADMWTQVDVARFFYIPALTMFGLASLKTFSGYSNVNGSSERMPNT